MIQDTGKGGAVQGDSGSRQKRAEDTEKPVSDSRKINLVGKS